MHGLPVFGVHPSRQKMRTSPSKSGFTLLEAAVVVAVLAILASILVIKIDHTMEDAEQTGTRASLQAVAEAFMGGVGAQGYVTDMRGFTALTDLRISNLVDDPQIPYDPVTRKGWRGPYVLSGQFVRNTVAERQGFFPLSGDRRINGDKTFLERHFYEDSTTSLYGEGGKGALGDQWGNPIVLQIPPASAISNPTPERRWKYARVVSAGQDGVLDTPPGDRLAGKLPNGTSTARGDDLVLFLNRADLYNADDAP